MFDPSAEDTSAAGSGGPLHAALILGPGLQVKSWQFEALREAIGSGLTVRRVLLCTDKSSRRIKFSQLSYYALAAVARWRIPQLRTVNVSSLLPKQAVCTRFAAEWEGKWQTIPAYAQESLQGCDVVIKFGMTLLKDPQDIPVPNGVLSYHHGDPEAFRGRPAGFYEQYSGQSTMGIIVQRLTNTLDGGDVLARAYSPIRRTSYARTLNRAYEAGIPLLSKAIEAIRESQNIEIQTLGKNYSIPNNRIVIRSLWAMSRARLSRIVYGAFREKRWRIGFVNRLTSPGALEEIVAGHISQTPLPPGVSFVADPVGISGNRLYCEAMNPRTGRGGIFTLENGIWAKIALPTGGGHLSYPQIVEDSGQHFLFPEMASVGAPHLFRLDASKTAVQGVEPLMGLEDTRLIDGTLHQHDGYWYLFAGTPETADYRLNLWWAKSLAGFWHIHPTSPVCIDPRRSRMAGPLVVFGNSLYRFGQDGSEQYGRAVSIHRVERLLPGSYAETFIGKLTIEGAFGPHTVTYCDDGVWVDFYTESWSITAGIRRAIARANF